MGIIMTKLKKINDFIERGIEIKKKEYQKPDRGLIIPDFIAGDIYDQWLSEIRIFINRHLKQHPLYRDFNSTLFHNKGSVHDFDKIVGHLKVLASDEEIIEENNISQATERATDYSIRYEIFKTIYNKKTPHAFDFGLSDNDFGQMCCMLQDERCIEGVHRVKTLGGSQYNIKFIDLGITAYGAQKIEELMKRSIEKEQTHI